MFLNMDEVELCCVINSEDWSDSKVKCKLDLLLPVLSKSKVDRCFAKDFDCSLG